MGLNYTVAGIATGSFTQGGTVFNAVMATQNFAQSGEEVFVTGVAINDRDGDNFYDIGEGRGGIAVQLTYGAANLGTANTAAAGGYGIKFSGGPVDVTFSGGALDHDVSVKINAGARSAKVDLSGSNEILSSASCALGDGAKSLVLLVRHQRM